METTIKLKISNQQAAGALGAVMTIAECIQAAGEIPSGHLYAAVMAHGCRLDTYESIIRLLTGTEHGPACVEKRGDLLVWVGRKW